ILCAMLYVYLSGFYHDFSFQYIQLKHAQWKQHIHAHPFQSALYYILIYVASVCLIIPDSIFLSILGGFLFPLPLAIIYIVFAETLGATLFFWAAQAALKDPLSKTRSHYLNKLHEQVLSKEIYYLLFFRFSHVLPYWVINIASAVLNISKWKFIWTTFIGVLPLAIVLAQGGSGLSHYFEQHTHFSMSDIFTTQIKIMLIGIGLLALIPLLYQYLKKKY
ncbi:MAG: VTT domain-containing protein, partial [Verrucomicrobia bacterium]|nr:VTT domain-containing protein [Verrucomicrobiota bacterium]